MNFVGIMLVENLFERICCCSREKFCGCRIFFWSLREIFVDFVGIYVRSDFF